MSAYDGYLTLHIGGSILWIGAAFALTLLTTRAGLAGDTERTAALAGDAEWLGPRLFLPTNLLVLVSAVLLVHEGSWGYGQLWIELGLAGFGASFLVGMLVFAPGWARVGRLAAGHGTGSPEVAARMRRLLLVSWVDVGLLLAVVFAMTAKPTPGEHGALALAAALPAAAALVGLALARERGGAKPARAV